MGRPKRNRSGPWATWQAREAVQRFDPLRTVDWRWRGALEAFAARRRLSATRDEPAVADAVRFLRAEAAAGAGRSRGALDRRWPGLVGARALAAGGGPRLWEAQARVLARQSDAEVAAACGVAPEVVGRFESLFFAVRDWLGAPDRILIEAIGTFDVVVDGVPELGRVWRSFGYHGGPLVLDVVIAACLGRPMPAWFYARPGSSDPASEEGFRLAARLSVEAALLPPGADLREVLKLHRLARSAELAGGMEVVPPSVAERTLSWLAESGFGRDPFADSLSSVPGDASGARANS